MSRSEIKGSPMERYSADPIEYKFSCREGDFYLVTAYHRTKATVRQIKHNIREKGGQLVEVTGIYRHYRKYKTVHLFPSVDGGKTWTGGVNPHLGAPKLNLPAKPPGNIDPRLG